MRSSPLSSESWVRTSWFRPLPPGTAASMPTPEDEPVDATKWGGGADREGRVAPLCPIRENVPSSYD
jgi:hypothetical protein